MTTHPDDEAARRALFAAYNTASVGYSLADVAAPLGVTRSAVSAFRLDPNCDPHAANMARYARPIDHRFVITIEGLPEPEEDAELAMLADLSGHSNPAMADEYHIEWVLARLTRTRLTLGLPQVHVAAAMGCSPVAVCQLERKGQPKRLSTLQRYTRALNEQAHLGLHLDPVYAMAVAA